MRLRGARMVFCSETEQGKRFTESTMKRLTGGDPIEANLMHKNPITFDPSHSLVMLTNICRWCRVCTVNGGSSNRK
ncbi:MULTISPECIES: DUF5906 domain-containing protein [unclassified Streptomyces]|uniref:DUF5906 domain-containing protein n=1 Tax=unclassified Streptomyces TaxID=2593676 RepID=UPI002257343C|nr:DUF5906 domain-containing protein [Streptomyces sp. NBC_00154]WTC76723.1 hypothetical protein OH719_01125 [Streptomyces sp. NBC_01653]WTD86387.1 hypothetical protein OG891_01125 [Streptomyces sp. NBC_01637]MCX5316083.1 hypothetical protein [Streptomyces sp. NBC_00154]WTC84480.1 hypothetical protein OH719_45745 [Streptomyces sp. NBC_01653]WTD94137.1 hypothetical protein OG891_45740 [Streptomyces sp. NBC_01637]